MTKRFVVFAVLLVFGNLAAIKAESAVAPLSADTSPSQKIASQSTVSDPHQVRPLWEAAALLARPLLFEHEDHQLFDGQRQSGNFGVFWPRPQNLPSDRAFKSYLRSEKEKIDFIVEKLGAGPEKNLTLYQMAQVYCFVHNTTPRSGEGALSRLRASGFAAAEKFMHGIDRVRGAKRPLAGLKARREDEAKLGRGEVDAPLSRKASNGKPLTLVHLQERYDRFLTSLGKLTAQNSTPGSL